MVSPYIICDVEFPAPQAVILCRIATNSILAAREIIAVP